MPASSSFCQALFLYLPCFPFVSPGFSLRSSSAARKGKYLDVEHSGFVGLFDVLAGRDLEESCCTCKLPMTDAAQRGQRTVELEELFVGGLGGELFAVVSRGLEGLGRHCCRFVVVVDGRECVCLSVGLSSEYGGGFVEGLGGGGVEGEGYFRRSAGSVLWCR